MKIIQYNHFFTHLHSFHVFIELFRITEIQGILCEVDTRNMYMTISIKTQRKTKLKVMIVPFN